jgi:amino acid transporter
MNHSKKRFGTFGGVFVPNILTILGVIMYLRMGWVVGNAGLYNTLIILLIANLITLFTSFSMSSIATNMRMKGGGAYYMISRSLGAEVGGSIGIPLYIAQALAISLYIVGFSESVVNIFPELNMLIISLSILVVLLVIALISAELVIKTQYIIFGIIILSLLSFFSGEPPSFENIHVSPQYSGTYDFWSVFAVFFPAVTGILSGVSLSGDLKDPSKNIPAGTIFSVIAGAVIYLLIAIWFSMVASPDELISNNTIMIAIARWGPLVYAGIWGATLSSALANILAAPRTLQALAADGIIFKIFRKGRGETNEPIIATVFTCMVVAGVLFIGELNTIASVLTMFFLITYGSVNLISFTERLINRPGFRPTFRIHWSFSLLGAAGCIWVMFVISPVACVTGFAVVFSIYLFLKRRQMQKNWGDVRKGVWSAIIQYALMQLEKLKDHPTSWRPNVLVISKELPAKHKLIQIAFSLTHKSGFLSCLNLLEANKSESVNLEQESKEFKELLHEKRINAFYKNVIVDNYSSGQMIASQIHGIGDFKHNTILLEWTESTKKWIFQASSEMSDQFKLIRFYRELNNSLLLLNVNPHIQRSVYQKIDVWWDPGQVNGSFMLLLAHLLVSSTTWGDSSVTVKTVVLKDKMEHTRTLLEELVQKSRIKANINVLCPDYSEEASLSIEYEKIQRKKKRQKKWFDTFRRILTGTTNNGANKESNDIQEDEKSNEPELEIKEFTDDVNETAEEQEEESEDNAIKEKLSEQMEEKDVFIINKNINEIIINNSKNADLVMLGFNIPPSGKEQKYIEKMEAMLEKLPDTLLINCPFDVELFE